MSNYPSAINTSGTVVGTVNLGDYYSSTYDPEPFYSTTASYNTLPTGTMYVHTKVPTSGTQCVAVNDYGVAVGKNVSTGQFAWCTSATGTPSTTLNPLTGQTAVVTGINDNGAIVGYCFNSSSVDTAVTWSYTGTNTNPTFTTTPTAISVAPSGSQAVWVSNVGSGHNGFIAGNTGTTGWIIAL
jgi:hypothetical protein